MLCERIDCLVIDLWTETDNAVGLTLTNNNAICFPFCFNMTQHPNHTLQCIHEYIQLHVIVLAILDILGGQARMTWAHSASQFLALWAALCMHHGCSSIVGLSRLFPASAVLWSSWSPLLFSTPATLASLTYRGKSFTTVLFVIPLFVRTFAEQTSPSFPVTRFSITAIFQLTCRPLSQTNTMSPTSICWPPLPAGR